MFITIEGHKRHSHEHRKDLAGEYKWGDAGQFLFIVIFIIGMLLDLFVLKISDSWQSIVPWYYRVVIFVPIFLLAGYFGQNAHKKVFKEQRKELTIIKTDIFSQIRHPIYFGSILTYLAFVVLSLSLIAFIIFILVIIYYLYLCRYEEKLLIQKLGEDYKNYMKQVPMLIPKLRKSNIK